MRSEKPNARLQPKDFFNRYFPSNPNAPKWRKRAMWATMIAGSAWRLVQVLTAPTPRLCPKCSYRMVYPVHKQKRRVLKDKKWLILKVIQWRCTSCNRQYETIGDSVFFTPAKDPSNGT
jgi:hypothetical protein